MEDKFFNNMRCLVLGLLVALVGIGTAQEEDCLDGWTAYRGACFKLFTETMTMGSANNFCQSLGGSNVLRPKTKGIQALVQGMIMDHPEASYWMHMIRSPMIEGGWTYLDSTWLIDCDFTNWGPASDGEVSSNDGANTEQCAILTPDTNWQWEDTSCGNTYSYICQKGDVNGTSPSNCGSCEYTFRHNTYLSPNLLVNDPCPSGWTVGPGHYCYKVSATVATFAGAESVCAAEQARLAAPYDERTHQFIVGMGMLVNPNSDHWVGIKPDTVNGGFKFSDDTE
ncbi:C-type lectin lectoxin-Thr1-like [Branchiostoma floridae x Branchiostoma belcheri]